MNRQLEFIEETLKLVAAKVAEKRVRPKATYADHKGYLAEADVLAHETMVEQIKKQFPEDLICSEEDQGNNLFGLDQSSSARAWVIDPICGTTNFIRGWPFYAHALSAVDHDGVNVAGIFNPQLNEMFLADRKLTTCNGNAVQVSGVNQLSEAIVNVNANLSDHQHCHQELRELFDLFAPPITRRIRIMESANLELAYIACGRLDGYVNRADKIWDLAAGSLLISSAGGKVFTLKGKISDLTACRGVIAGNKPIAEKMNQIINKRGPAL